MVRSISFLNYKNDWTRVTDARFQNFWSRLLFGIQNLDPVKLMSRFYESILQVKVQQDQENWL